MYMRNKVKKIILFSYMPKTDTDYSNTIFYKIQCKNQDVKDMYIGHTTNFVQRKLAHKYSCIYDKCANYHCKVYNVIRENGGWDNWNMEIIAFHNCEDLYTARKLEQQYFEQYNATLNSVEPLPKPKTILSKNIPVKIENKQMQTSVEVENKNIKNTKSHICEKCNFVCINKYDFNKHLGTAKHNRIHENTQIMEKIYECDKCSRQYKFHSGLWKHKQSYKHQECAQSINAIDTATVITLLKQNIEFQQRMVDVVTNMITTT